MLVGVAGVLGFLGLHRLQRNSLGKVLDHHCHVLVASVSDRKRTTHVHAPSVEQPFDGKRVELKGLCVKLSLDPVTYLTASHDVP